MFTSFNEYDTFVNYLLIVIYGVCTAISINSNQTKWIHKCKDENYPCVKMSLFITLMVRGATVSSDIESTIMPRLNLDV